MLTFRLFLFLNFIFFLISACHSKSAAEKNAQDLLLIGEVDSMTGSEATFGVNTFRGIQVGILEVNEAGGIRGKKLKLVTNDSQGKPDEAARAITKMITQDKVVAIITGVNSSSGMAIAPIAQKHQVAFIATGATNPKLTEIGPFIFRVCFIDEFQGRVLAQFTLETLKFKKLAILRDTISDYSIGLADVFRTAFKKGGGEILLDQSYSGGDMDFKSQLTTLRAKKADAIFIPGSYTDVALIARQARDLGMEMPLIGGDAWDSPKLMEIGGKALAGSYFTSFFSGDDRSEKVKKFQAQYTKVYGEAPDRIAVMGYEGLKYLTQAIERSKSFSPQDIQQAIAHSPVVEGLTGKMFLDSHRNAIKSVFVFKINPLGEPVHFTTIHPD